MADNVRRPPGNRLRQGSGGDTISSPGFSLSVVLPGDVPNVANKTADGRLTSERIAGFCSGF